MHNQIAFLDEWGNNGLDFTKTGTTTHFIVAVVTLPKNRLAEAEATVEAVRERHFQTGAIKSSKVAQHHVRRVLVLSALLEAPFQVLAVVVDKRQLVSQGFQYKGSFYKFLHSLADRELYQVFPDLELIADAHGSDTFMEGFVQYVQKRHVPNLFDQASFSFVNDKSSVLIQAADFIAGTLARCFDETVLDNSKEFMSLLSPKLMTLKHWPESFAPSLVNAAYDQSQYNPTLAELGLNLAQDFVHRKANSLIQQEVDQFTALSFLLFTFRHINPTRYISSRELMQHIEDRRGKPISIHYFQAKVIAPLRDAGVLIASSAKGYKIPACERDLYEFINHSNSMIQPLLARIKKCRDRVRLATNNTIDPLNRPEYDTLKRLID